MLKKVLYVPVEWLNLMSKKHFYHFFLEKMSKRFGRYEKYAYLCNRNRERWRDSSAG